MSDFLLTQIINYGAPILGAIVFLGAIGLPIPATVVVIAVGAFCRQGILAWHITGLVALTCVVIGDCLGYALGHYAREPVLRRFGGSNRWKEAEASFLRWGGMSIFLTRFLITGIAVPINFLAGTGAFRFRKFLFYDLVGEAIWVFGYGGLGYLFGTQWEAVSDFTSNFGGLIFGLIILIAGVILARRWLRSKQRLLV